MSDGRLEVAIAVSLTTDFVQVDQTQDPPVVNPPNLFDLKFNDDLVRIDDVRMPQFKGNLAGLLPQIANDINTGIPDNAEIKIRDAARVVELALLAQGNG